jgi:hypothetical protein
MTEGRPEGASTGRLQLDQFVDSVPVREVVSKKVSRASWSSTTLATALGHLAP